MCAAKSKEAQPLPPALPGAGVHLGFLMVSLHLSSLAHGQVAGQESNTPMVVPYNL